MFDEPQPTEDIVPIQPTEQPQIVLIRIVFYPDGTIERFEFS